MRPDIKTIRNFYLKCRITTAVWSIFLHEKIDEKRARALPLTRGGAFTPIKATPSPIQPLMCFHRRQGDFRKAKIKGL